MITNDRKKIMICVRIDNATAIMIDELAKLYKVNSSDIIRGSIRHSYIYTAGLKIKAHDDPKKIDKK